VPERFARDGWESLGVVASGDALSTLTGAADAGLDGAVRRARYPSREAAARVVYKWPLPVAGPFLPWIARTLGAALAVRTGADLMRCVGLALVVKAPRQTFVAAWHRDVDVWPTRERRGLTLWLGLDDVDAECGGLRYLPGSHLGGDVPNIEGDPAMPRTTAGEALVHHAALWHTTGPNRTERWRRAVVASIVPADSARASGEWDPRREPVFGG
jgi:hypothetical protein